MALERVDNIEVDLAFLEIVMEQGDGGTVEFTVKELLTGISDEVKALREEGRDRPTKEDLREVKAELAAVKLKVEAGEIRWAKLAGAMGMAAVLGGGVGAAIVRAAGLA